jgi:hypothetical protein
MTSNPEEQAKQAEKLESILNHTKILHKHIYKLQAIQKLEECKTGKLHISNPDENCYLTISVDEDEDVRAGVLSYLHKFYENKMTTALRELKEL